MPFVPARELTLEPGEVAMSLGPGTFGSHAGLVYRLNPASSDLAVIHLAWNEFARVDRFPGELCWVAQKLDITRTTGLFLEEYLRDNARRILKARIKYGIGVLKADGSFGGEGYVRPDDSDGLTCATFVWQLLKYASLNPIVAETWPESGNSEWAVAIALMMIFSRRADVDQGLTVFKQRENARRLKPTELGVPAGYPFEEWPFEYERVIPEEPQVMDTLNQHCPVPKPEALHFRPATLGGVFT